MSRTMPPTTRADETPAIARHGRLRSNGVWTTVAKVAASVIAVVLASGTAVAAYAAFDLAATAQPSVTLGNEDVLAGVRHFSTRYAPAKAIAVPATAAIAAASMLFTSAV